MPRDCTDRQFIVVVDEQSGLSAGSHTSSGFMNAFDLGKVTTINRGLVGAVGKASQVYTGIGTAEAGLFLAGAASPFVGPAVATLGGVALGLYGGKQIYEGIKGFFEG